MKKVDAMLDQVQAGKGTIGKLLVDPTLYDKAVGIVERSARSC